MIAGLTMESTAKIARQDTNDKNVESYRSSGLQT
jgi:hypothetical protein